MLLKFLKWMKFTQVVAPVTPTRVTSKASLWSRDQVVTSEMVNTTLPPSSAEKEKGR